MLCTGQRGQGDTKKSSSFAQLKLQETSLPVCALQQGREQLYRGRPAERPRI